MGSAPLPTIALQVVYSEYDTCIFCARCETRVMGTLAAHYGLHQLLPDLVHPDHARFRSRANSLARPHLQSVR